MRSTLDTLHIDTLRNIPDIVPIYREFYEPWTIKVFNRQHHQCRNYLSSNRRGFYKILFITEGDGIFTIGLNTYSIREPTILFLHPSDIISWKNLSDISGGHYVLFKNDFINTHPQLKMTIDHFGFFRDKEKSVLKIPVDQIPKLSNFFDELQREESSQNDYKLESMQTYMQLIMVACMKLSNFIKPDAVSNDFRYIYRFFELLEQEASTIGLNSPIKIKTAKEFAQALSVHPNYLNALLKKCTGENVSAHIRSRLLDEAKALLLQTNWTLQQISYCMGFADQPNFSFFFKKNTGLTPTEFRHHFSIQS